MSKLAIFYKDQLLTEYQILSMEITIGSETDNIICLQFPGISKKQCKINKVRNDFILTDLAGAKDTLLNQKPAIAEKLKSGDKIQIGPLVIMCMIELLESLVDVVLQQLTPGQTQQRVPQSKDKGNQVTPGTTEIKAECRLVWEEKNKLTISSIEQERTKKGLEADLSPVQQVHVFIVGVVIIIIIVLLISLLL